MTELHTLEQYPQWTIPKFNYTLQGRSRSADRSGFMIKEFGIFFDAGICTHAEPKIILITHTHSDHCAVLPRILTGQKNICDIYVPQESREVLINYMDAYKKLSSSDIHRKFTHVNSIKGVSKDDVFEFIIKNKKFIVDVLPCYHTIPTVSYMLSETRKKLKEEYVGLSGQEIIKLRKSGTKVSHILKYPILAYICDTNINGLNIIDTTLVDCSTIIVECTFLDDVHLEQANIRKHIHWKQLEPIIDKNKNKTFVLIHFSMRYKDQAIIDFFRNQKYNNIVLWLDSGCISIKN